MKSLRTAILSDHEREIIKRYLESSERLNGIIVLRHRLKRAIPQIKEDLEFVEKFLEGP